MYRNLEAEMARHSITKKAMAEVLGVKRYPTLVDKLNGKTPLKIEEAMKIRDTFFPRHTLDYLFCMEKEVIL